MNTPLTDKISWKRYPLLAGAAVGQTDLVVGSVGSGKPIGLVTAGIHGDEGPWGSWAIHKLLERIDVDNLRGTLRVVPVANPFAMEADARNSPFDSLDLNRVFPGDPNGSHTERLAALLVEHAASEADVVIDIHGGGSWCVNAFVFQFAGSEALSSVVGAPFMVSGPDRSVTLTGYARSKGARVTAIEMGGRGPEEELWADRIANGLQRVLEAGGILAKGISASLPTPAPTIPVGPSTVLRPSRGGVFSPALHSEDVGHIVPKDTVLGWLLDPVTRTVVETFRAPFLHTAVLLLRPTVCRVEGGAMLYVLAEPLSG